MNDPKHTRNGLSDTHHYQLMRFLDTPFNKQEMLKYTDEEMAAKATKSLSFIVTAGSIIRARAILGVEKKDPKSGRCDCAADIQAMDELINGQATAISVLQDGQKNVITRLRAIELRLGIRPTA